MRGMGKLVVGMALGIGLLATAARAEVKLPAIIGDHMVLQQDKPITIWGWANAGQKVTVKLAGQEQNATAAADRKWSVKFEPIKAGGPLEMTVAGENTLTVRDILVGEVWICSGQSNMTFQLKRAHNAETEIAKAKRPKMRLFIVKAAFSATPREDCAGQWTQCTPETAAGFSAVGYFFGRDLQEALNVPVGMVHTSWGGTPAQAWTSLQGLESSPLLKDYANQAKANRAREAKGEQEKGKSKLNQSHPSVLNNAMIAPLVPFAIRGAIWYQGEANASRPVEYRTLFPAMIRDWRRMWGQGDFPFVFVQLANFMQRKPEPTQNPQGWPGLREAQTMTLAEPNTAMAVAIDVGQGNDIHPRDKSDVGKRLALGALKVAYGRDLVHSGPMYKEMKVEDGKIRIRFDSVGKGLKVAAAPSTQPSVPQEKPLGRLVGFAIAGEDHKFVWAEAKIEGDSVVVWSDAVRKPVAVRYAWADNPECNLYNSEDLPASPFRTDDWQ